VLTPSPCRTEKACVREGKTEEPCLPLIPCRTPGSTWGDEWMDPGTASRSIPTAALTPAQNQGGEKKEGPGRAAGEARSAGTGEWPAGASPLQHSHLHKPSVEQKKLEKKKRGQGGSR